jgi:hypothetical protein
MDGFSGNEFGHQNSFFTLSATWLSLTLLLFASKQAQHSMLTYCIHFSLSSVHHLNYPSADNNSLPSSRAM